MKAIGYLLVVGLAMFLIFSLSGCSSGGGGGDDDTCPEPTLEIAVCDPDLANFTNPTTINNEFFPLAAGTELILEGEDDGETIRVEITVSDPIETEVVDEVVTLVMVETEYEDGELVEISYNFIAQADDGTVCYFGEDVDIYEGGVVVSNDGAWRAGIDGALPGILMPADPQVGDAFFQESAPGVAEDMSSVVAFGRAISVPAGDFDDTLTAKDCNPLEDAETDRKVYVRGIGLAIDEDAELIEYLQP
jgi:hypothetical protein